MKIDRASATDRLQLASDVGPVPQQVGAVLVLDGHLDPDEVRDVVERRTRAIPRLRQRLVRPPIGLGGPYWVDDEAFAVADHVRSVACPAPGDQDAALAVAADVVTTRLSPAVSPWALVHVTGLASGGDALVAVFDHVVADGIGGLAVLAGLVDGAPEAVRVLPQRPPRRRELVVEATRARLEWFTTLGGAPARLRSAVRSARATRLPKAEPCSLLVPTGARRAFAVARLPLEGVVDAAHRSEATVNDVVLAAVGGALQRTLRRRGEPVVAEFVVTVPVSGRRSTTAGDLGNQVTARPTVVPGVGDPQRRLEAVAERRRRAAPVDDVDLAGPLFRLLSHLHLLRWFIDRQHLVHTFVTNLRGPTERLHFSGTEVQEVIPISAIAGNVTVAFAVLSYAGTLVVTVVADPAACPDVADLRDDLQAELEALVVARAPASP